MTGCCAQTLLLAHRTPSARCRNPRCLKCYTVISRRCFYLPLVLCLVHGASIWARSWRSAQLSSPRRTTSVL